jgi:two-component system sensor histidine kinase DegS
MVLKSGKEDVSPVDEFLFEINSEYDQTNRSLKDIGLMLDQSQNELNKLTQKNSTISSQVQQTQTNGDSTTRNEMRSMYENALDAQQRLFVMRGQIEKLQNEQTFLRKYLSFLDKAKKINDVNKTAAPAKKGSASDTVQMLINAQEVERQRLSRQMHDGPAQALSNFILQTEIAMRLFDVDQNRAKDELGSLKNSAMSTFQKVREFIFELRPMMLDDLGLVPTINRYVDSYRTQTGLDIDLVISGSDIRMESYLEVLIFRSIQELLSSASHHSQASKIKIQLNIDNDSVRVSIDDNGKGNQAEEAASDSNLGIKLIRDRIEMLGGRMDIDSVENQGTRVSIEMPMVKAANTKPA